MSDIYEVRASWTDKETGEVEEWVETYTATQSLANAYIKSKQKALQGIPKQYLPDYDEPVLTVHKVDSVLTVEPDYIPVYHTLRNNETDEFSHMAYTLVNLNDEDESNITLPGPIASIIHQAAQKKGSLRVSILENENREERTLFSSTNHTLLQSIIDAE